MPGIQIQTLVGPTRNADGTQPSVRAAKTGELVTQDSHGRYHEACVRNNIFSAANQASVTTPAGLTASSLNYTLYNPAGSSGLLSILNIAIGINAAPAAASIVYLVQNNNPLQAAPATNTALIVGNNLLANTSGIGKVYSTTTLAAVPTILRPLAFIPAAATVTGFVIHIDVAGMIVVQPGTYVSIQASTAIGLICSIDWEEIALL